LVNSVYKDSYYDDLVVSLYINSSLTNLHNFYIYLSILSSSESFIAL